MPELARWGSFYEITGGDACALIWEPYRLHR